MGNKSSKGDEVVTENNAETNHVKVDVTDSNNAILESFESFGSFVRAQDVVRYIEGGGYRGTLERENWKVYFGHGTEVASWTLQIQNI